MRSLAFQLAMDNPSFVLKGIENVVYEQRPIPDSRFHLFPAHGPSCRSVADNETLVEVKKTGICGSDVRVSPSVLLMLYLSKGPLSGARTHRRFHRKCPDGAYSLIQWCLAASQYDQVLGHESAGVISKGMSI